MRVLFLAAIAPFFVSTSTAQTGCEWCDDEIYPAQCYDAVSGIAGCVPHGTYCTDTGACDPTGYCFLAGTLVNTPSGPFPIENLRKGDKVRTMEYGRLRTVTVTKTYRSIASE